MINKEIKPMIRIIQGGGRRALGERAKRERDLFGNTNWIDNRFAYRKSDGVRTWNAAYNNLKDVMDCEYQSTYSLSIEDIISYIHASEGELELILRDPNLLDGKSHNIFNKTVRYITQLPISSCATYIYNHPELLGDFFYEPNTGTLMKKLSDHEDRYDIYSQLIKQKHGKHASRKKIDLIILANSWGEDRVPEDSPYYRKQKKGN